MNLLQLLALMDSLLRPFAWKRVQSEAAPPAQRAASRLDVSWRCLRRPRISEQGDAVACHLAACSSSSLSFQPASSAGASTHLPKWLRPQGGGGGGSKRGHGCAFTFSFGSGCNRSGADVDIPHPVLGGFKIKYLISISSAVATQQALARCPWQQQGT